jgi:2-(3-amino-3-carboxypropyl)histidine synthase
MKKLFIHAKSNLDITKILKKITIKEKIGLVTTIQHLHQLKQAKKTLPNSTIIGSIIGCKLNKALKAKVDAFLFIGSGKFHPLELALRTNKKVYIANPYNNKISQITKQEIEKRKKQIKGSQIKLLSAKKIGILVSTKYGQYNLKQALTLHKKYKNSYIFLFNILNEKELENFPQIDCWINTSCPRIEYNKIINIKDLPK